MTPAEMELVKDSFQEVFPVRDVLAKTFYAELFAIAPNMRALFPTDMFTQRLKFVELLDCAVLYLNDPKRLIDTVSPLARRHMDYGAQPEHFGPIGVALISALNTHIPHGMSRSQRAAWLAAYTMITDVMIGHMQARQY